MGAAAFVAAARALQGARWRHRGRKPWALDCIGLVVLAGTRAGLNVQDETGYGREPWDDRLCKGCRERFGAPRPASEARLGDIAIIRWGKAEPSHMGIVGDHPHGLSLIHVHNLHGWREQRIDERMLGQIVEIYRPWPEASP